MRKAEKDSGGGIPGRILPPAENGASVDLASSHHAATKPLTYFRAYGTRPGQHRRNGREDAVPPSRWIPLIIPIGACSPAMMLEVDNNATPFLPPPNPE